MSHLVHELDHPLIHHHLCTLRDMETPPSVFRSTLRALTHLLAGEATRHLRTESVQVATPLEPTIGEQLSGRVGLIPVLRAGLSMVDPLLTILPDAEVWHLGFYRDETSLLPIAYYDKLPPNSPVETAFLLDPMLATGGSASAALDTLNTWGVPHCVYLGILAAPEGIRRLNEDHPNVPIYVCALDEELNDKGFILPGLGDAGDRAFNT